MGVKQDFDDGGSRSDKDSGRDRDRRRNRDRDRCRDEDTVLSGIAVFFQGIQKQKKRIASYLIGVKQDFNDSGSRRIKDWTTVFRIEKVAILKSWRKESDHGTNENRTISRQLIDMQYEFFKILVQKKIISKYQVY